LYSHHKYTTQFVTSLQYTLHNHFIKSSQYMTSSSLTYSTILKALFPFLFQLTDRRRKVVGNNVFLTSNFFLLWKRIINIIYIYIFTEFNFTEFNFADFGPIREIKFREI